MAKDGKKKVTHAQRTGRRGEHLVADLVLEMGFIWHGADVLEGGIDGFIELADLDYWLAMSGAVILVLSNPTTREAYYVSLKEYFVDVERRVKSKVVFDKKTDGLRGKTQALLDLARREAERSQLSTDALLLGPLDWLGLTDQLDEAQRATDLARNEPSRDRWLKAADLWGSLAKATPISN